MTSNPAVYAINRQQGLALFDCGTTTPVTHWMDSSGHPSEPERAVVCVCGSPQLGWHTVDLTQFDRASTPQ